VSWALRRLPDVRFLMLDAEDRSQILNTLANAENTSKDDETRKNLAAFGAALAAAK
jgi:hypothetical protein